MRSTLAVVLVGAGISAGCKHPPVVYPEAPPVYYSVTFETARTTEGGVTPRRSDVLASDAGARLRPGRKVAFLPPDACTTTSVAPSGSGKSSTAIVMRCGALLASLEAEVGKAGYAVVSWQALKSESTKESQQLAKQLGVQVLFEVNDLTLGQREPGARQVSNLRFARADGPDREQPIAVMPEVAQRCAAQIRGLDRSSDNEYLATVNLKAVEVSTGQALWLYQNTVGELVGDNAASGQKLYYRANGTRPAPPSSSQGTLGTLGGVAAAVGFTLAGIGLIGSAVEDSSDPAEESSTDGLVTWGLVIGGIGLAMYGVDYVTHTPDRTVPDATYPEANAVLCTGEPLLDPWAAPATPTQAAAQSSYTFTESAGAARDEGRERDERLTRKSAEDFVQALREVTKL